MLLRCRSMCAALVDSCNVLRPCCILVAMDRCWESVRAAMLLAHVCQCREFRLVLLSGLLPLGGHGLVLGFNSACLQVAQVHVASLI